MRATDRPIRSGGSPFKMFMLLFIQSLKFKKANRVMGSTLNKGPEQLTYSGIVGGFQVLANL